MANIKDTRCIRILTVFYDDPEIDADPNDPEDIPDTVWCQQPGKPIMTVEGIRYVCDDCRPVVEAQGMLNGLVLMGKKG